MRPAEVETLLGDASKAREKMGWAPKVSFNELVRMMFEQDLYEAKQERVLLDHGLANKRREAV
jgi:GDPmannose 4,6-dehydratase